MKELLHGGYQSTNKEFETFTNRQDRFCRRITPTSPAQPRFTSSCVRSIPSKIITRIGLVLGIDREDFEVFPVVEINHSHVFLVARRC